jgi:hypothetical protein
MQRMLPLWYEMGASTPAGCQGTVWPDYTSDRGRPSVGRPTRQRLHNRYYAGRVDLGEIAEVGLTAGGPSTAERPLPTSRILVPTGCRT